MKPRITLLTDFGTQDGYVAAMKGVLAAIAPGVFIDDVAHDIPFGDVHAAAHALARYWRRYPPGTIHVCVVDPGVGSRRRALAVASERRYLVGPDNGVFTHALTAGAYAISLENSEFHGPDSSATFHGRDIFAPVAAHLANGEQLDAFGPAIMDPVHLHWPVPTRHGDDIAGEVIHVDRFGNLLTNIPGDWLAPNARVSVDGHDVGLLRRTYADVDAGQPLALIDSEGKLEIAWREGSAAGRRGMVVRVTHPR